MGRRRRHLKVQVTKAGGQLRLGPCRGWGRAETWASVHHLLRSEWIQRGPGRGHLQQRLAEVQGRATLNPHPRQGWRGKREGEGGKPGGPGTAPSSPARNSSKNAGSAPRGVRLAHSGSHCTAWPLRPLRPPGSSQTASVLSTLKPPAGFSGADCPGPLTQSPAGQPTPGLTPAVQLGLRAPRPGSALPRPLGRSPAFSGSARE